MKIVLWSSGALLLGFVLDAILGDPYRFPHIVRWIGRLISLLDKKLRHSVPGGIGLVFIVTVCCTGISAVLLFLGYGLAPPIGFVAESFLCWQLLAAKSLQRESMKVYHRLQEGDLEAARHQLSMIVGRDTEMLDKDGILRATVETVAENTSDGVTAPLLYMMAGGAALGCLYKSVNTMDSMVGYQNERYRQFGRAAAKTDDLLNIIPARLTALLMISAAFLLKLDGRNALAIWRRDRRKHESPNSAQTEAVCAGALGVQLAGPASYSGRMRDKPTIGDPTHPIEADDIVQANRLMFLTSLLTLAIAVLFRTAVLGVILYASR